MKKIIILILCVFILTGCNVEYTIKIDKNSYDESIIIISETDMESNIVSNHQKPIEAFINSEISSETNEKLPGIEYYETSKYLNDGMYNLNLSYEFKQEEILKSNIINSSVSLFKVFKENNVYKIHTGANIKVFKTENINNLKIKIILDDTYEVTYSNAQNISGNVHEWSVNKENYQTSPITFEYKQKTSENNTSNVNNNQNIQIDKQEEVDNTGDLILVIILFLAFVLVLLGIIVGRKKFTKNN